MARSRYKNTKVTMYLPCIDLHIKGFIIGAFSELGEWNYKVKLEDDEIMDIKINEIGFLFTESTEEKEKLKLIEFPKKEESK